MKQVTVISASQSMLVKIRGNDSNALTASDARAARDIAFGLGARVTVHDGETFFRVTKSVRRLRSEPR